MKVDLEIEYTGKGWTIKGDIEMPEEIVELLKRLVYPPTYLEGWAKAEVPERKLPE